MSQWLKDFVKDSILILSDRYRIALARHSLEGEVLWTNPTWWTTFELDPFVNSQADWAGAIVDEDREYAIEKFTL